MLKDSEIFIALTIALTAAIFAIRLGCELYK